MAFWPSAGVLKALIPGLLFFFLKALCFMSMCKHSASGINPVELGLNLKSWEQKPPSKRARSGFGHTLLTTGERLYLFTFTANVTVLFRNVSSTYKKLTDIFSCHLDG